MKASKWLIATGVALSAGLLLTACSQSSSSTNNYTYVYSSDPDSLNYLATNRATTGDVISNLVDGLFENDKYGNLVPSIAKSWTVSKDGLTYTYKLRDDAKWYTSDGEEYAEVKAQDFVTGLKYAADENSEAIYLVQDSVKGLDAYIRVKIRILTMLVSRLLTTIHSNTLWLALSHTGTLKQPARFSSQSMKSF